MVNEPVGMKILRDLAQTGPGVVLKWFMVIGLVMYSFFALIVIKQVGIMSETFESDVNGTVRTVAWLHFFIAVFLAVMAAII
jgi:hypothetical protein